MKVRTNIVRYIDNQCAIVQAETSRGDLHYAWYLDVEETVIMSFTVCVEDNSIAYFQTYDFLASYLQEVQKTNWIWQAVPKKLKDAS